MRANEQSRLLHQSDGTAAAGTSGGGGGASRALKKQKQENLSVGSSKDRSFLLSVSFFRRFWWRIDRESALVAATTLFRMLGHWVGLLPALPSTTGAGNLQMEPPSNQISIGSIKDNPLSLPEDGRITGMKRLWPFHHDNDPVSSSLVCSRPAFTLPVRAPSANIHETFGAESRCGNASRNTSSRHSEVDRQFPKEETDRAKDCGFLTLGPSAPPILPITPSNPEMRQPLFMVPPFLIHEFSGMQQYNPGNVVETSPWRPFRLPFYEFFPTTPSRQREKNAEEKTDKSGDGIDLSLKL